MGDLPTTFQPRDAASHADVGVISTEVTLSKVTSQFAFTATNAAAVGTSLNNASVPGGFAPNAHNAALTFVAPEPGVVVLWVSALSC